MGTTSKAATVYPSGTPEFTPNFILFLWGSCCSLASCVMFCESLFVFLVLMQCRCLLLAIVLSVILQLTASDNTPLVSSSCS